MSVSVTSYYKNDFIHISGIALDGVNEGALFNKDSVLLTDRDEKKLKAFAEKVNDELMGLFKEDGFKVPKRTYGKVMDGLSGRHINLGAAYNEDDPGDMQVVYITGDFGKDENKKDKVSLTLRYYLDYNNAEKLARYILSGKMKEKLGVTFDNKYEVEYTFRVNQLPRKMDDYDEKCREFGFINGWNDEIPPRKMIEEIRRLGADIGETSVSSFNKRVTTGIRIPCSNNTYIENYSFHDGTAENFVRDIKPDFQELMYLDNEKEVASTKQFVTDLKKGLEGFVAERRKEAVRGNKDAALGDNASELDLSGVRNKKGRPDFANSFC